jgi:hypothetical protein
VDVTADLEAACSPAALFEWIDDLERYPEWLEIVPRAGAVERDAGDPGPAWSVDLRGRLGPVARSKRLRMVRTVHEPDQRVRFERRELDGRDHSPWVLDAEISETHDGSRLVMHLHYGGSFVGRLLEGILRDEIEQSRPRLRALVETG